MAEKVVVIKQRSLKDGSLTIKARKETGNLAEAVGRYIGEELAVRGKAIILTAPSVPSIKTAEVVEERLDLFNLAHSDLGSLESDFEGIKTIARGYNALVIVADEETGRRVLPVLRRQHGSLDEIGEGAKGFEFGVHGYTTIRHDGSTKRRPK